MSVVRPALVLFFVLASCSLSDLDRFYLAPDAAPCIPNCEGKPCGARDGCNGTCLEGPCGTGLHCVTGVCRCDETSCVGCCKADACVSGTQVDACGWEGRACDVCQIPDVCLANSCHGCGHLGEACCANVMCDAGATCSNW